jgi:ABC transporter with metal-binding/Fe-S-binding domain ATP-binding protein
MRLAALISGGKDSALALNRVLTSGRGVKYLVAMIPKNPESWMFHYPNVEWTDLFSEASGFYLIKGKTSGKKEEELKDLKKVLESLDIDGIISGTVFSQYQKTRLDKICAQLDLELLVPLWQENPLEIIVELIELGFHVIITGVFALGLNKKWLGKRINTETLNELIRLNHRYQISIIGEGGEYESLVLDAPYFKKKIKILKTEIVWQDGSGYLKIKNAKLVEKTVL